MNAITVKYLSATDSKPARLKAACANFGTVTVPFPHELSGLSAYSIAADALCQRLGWRGPLAGGWTGTGSAAFLLVPAAFTCNYS